jgi:hypothetical protein
MTRRATVTQVASGRRHIKVSAPLLADRLPLYRRMANCALRSPAPGQEIQRAAACTTA